MAAALLNRQSAGLSSGRAPSSVKRCNSECSSLHLGQRVASLHPGGGGGAVRRGERRNCVRRCTALEGALGPLALCGHRMDTHANIQAVDKDVYNAHKPPQVSHPRQQRMQGASTAPQQQRQHHACGRPLRSILTTTAAATAAAAAATGVICRPLWHQGEPTVPTWALACL